MQRSLLLNRVGEVAKLVRKLFADSLEVVNASLNELPSRRRSTCWTRRRELSGFRVHIPGTIRYLTSGRINSTPWALDSVWKAIRFNAIYSVNCAAGIEVYMPVPKLWSSPGTSRAILCACLLGKTLAAQGPAKV